ncbi:DNA-processing protein DprA [Thioclava sp. A2]|uniref:DNA-processing protein DprA n=1 Tax=Thioclava sp. FCG-A2 TaxID=3080562 RepID=UPI0029534193|nr:DNA-processing protein DprA [Thioclava sp. A2]MDV7271728.1 DNA-processing protein DprA [Thioclava sp. A2]
MKADLFSIPTPFTPPTTEEDNLSVLRLIRSRRVGPTTFKRLLHEHGSAQAALDALPEVARIAGVKDYSAFSITEAEAELRAGTRAGARLLCYGGTDYPAQLMELDDPPAVLWALGRIELLTTSLVALVGARNASSLGRRMTQAIAQELGQAGVTTVSGLARGIDTIAHETTLDTGTIAVQAGGIDVIYPQENKDLAGKIAETGLRLSEGPPGLQPQARHFPQRNRIISGLSQAVVVIEAAPQSGSLITARCALDQGREVMAVPGHPFDGRAGGCNQLLRDGALLVRGGRDVLEALVLEHPPETPPAPPDAAPPKPPATDIAARLLDLLGPSPTAEDQVIRDLEITASEFAVALLPLELDGLVLRHPGGKISRLPTA